MERRNANPGERNDDMNKAIVILSGGLDSTVLAATLKRSYEVVCVSVNYGQRHKRELTAARAVCEAMELRHVVVDVPGLLAVFGGSSQTDMNVPVPEGHYAEESMKATVVPNRNMVLLAIGGALAVAEKADVLAYAAHGGDHAIYPDCREAFAKPMADALLNCDWHKVMLERPFLGLTKADIVAIGNSIGAPLDLTYSCYNGKEIHCGKCGTCVERREAFVLAQVQDPTQYDS